jgi:bis(5'-nucleosyl)-tetraphosphatase (symmetrical)
VVGDLINRGPANLKALDLVRPLVEDGRAHYVIGNHELALLRVAFELQGTSERDTLAEVLDSTEADDWVEWIRRRPVLVCGEIAGCRYALVHAALHPDVPLERQAERARTIESRLGADDVDVAVALLERVDPPLDPDRDWLGRFTQCRSVHGDAWRSAPPADVYEPWHAAWSRAHHGYGVVYGHWALQGLHVDAYLRGLDTGCVHHGRGHDGFLTAWLPAPERRGAEVFSVPDHAFWQIPARRRYYPY